MEVLCWCGREYDMHIHIRNFPPFREIEPVVRELGDVSIDKELIEAGSITCSQRSIRDDECSGPAPSNLDVNTQ